MDATQLIANASYLVQFRQDAHPDLYRSAFLSLSDAIAYGLSTGEPFDVSAPSGAIVWSWAQRP